jgi:hypothetical protein
MSLIENAISGASLKRIRHRRAQEQDSNEEQANELVRKTAVSIREAQFSDCENVDQLNRKLGQGPYSLETGAGYGETIRQSRTSGLPWPFP